MSGVAGGNRIKKTEVDQTLRDFTQKVLNQIPGFIKVQLTGSLKSGTKADYGDLDLLTQFEGDDKAEVKQRIIKAVSALPDDVIVPFRSPKYQGRKYYNSGELITVLFPISGLPDQYIQVDCIISLSEQEQNFKNAFLDLPAEKQGLLLGLVKTITLEEEPSNVLARLGIPFKPLEPGEEYEFNLSSVDLSLRKVKLQDFKEIAREQLWRSNNWEDVVKLLSGYNLDLSFEDLLKETSSKLKNPRSRKRVAGIFKSMVSVKSGEVGTAKGAGKEAALQKVAQMLESFNLSFKDFFVRK